MVAVASDLLWCLMKTYYPLSRRRFLTTALGAGGAILLGPTWLSAVSEAVDPRVAQVMSRTIGIDMHNHVYPPGTEPQRQEERSLAPDLSIGEELKRSRLTAVCASFGLDFLPK